MPACSIVSRFRGPLAELLLCVGLSRKIEKLYDEEHQCVPLQHEVESEQDCALKYLRDVDEFVVMILG